MTDNTEDQVILFGPRSGKALRRLYPEIDTHPIFKILGSADLLFAWYIGIPGSPIDSDLFDNIRLRMAAAKCFEKDEHKKKSYALGDFPDSVKQAIRAFERTSPEARLMAKHMTQKTFYKFQKLLDVDVEKDFLITKTIGKGDVKEEITETDWTGRKQYVDSATKIIETLPELIKKLEEGFGITEIKKNENVAIGEKSIDKFHQAKKENS